MFLTPSACRCCVPLPGMFVLPLKKLSRHSLSRSNAEASCSIIGSAIASHPSKSSRNHHAAGGLRRGLTARHFLRHVRGRPGTTSNLPKIARKKNPTPQKATEATAGCQCLVHAPTAESPSAGGRRRRSWRRAPRTWPARPGGRRRSPCGGEGRQGHRGGSRCLWLRAAAG